MEKIFRSDQKHSPAAGAETTSRVPHPPLSIAASGISTVLGVLSAAVIGIVQVPAAAAEKDRSMVFPPSDRVVLERRIQTMGTWMHLWIEAPNRSLALRATQSALDAVDRAERRLSTWRQDTELARVNEYGWRGPVAVSPELRRDLEDSFNWSKATHGAFSPTIGALVDAWDLRGAGRVPDPEELGTARRLSDSGGARLDHFGVRLSSIGVRIDEGGFGKGAALRDALDAAASAGSICSVLDFGGQVAVRGDCVPIQVAIADPADREIEIAHIRMSQGCVATSGMSERSMVVDGARVGHIIDPRTGAPAADWGSVTVIARDCLAADALSTALYVMGPHAGARWAAADRNVEAVFSEHNTRGNRLRATEGLRALISTSPGASIEWIPEIHHRPHGPP
jgi:thiamine biosynthesis lipoprotein